jgi:ABC-type proline/glycine betaine transport system ATPase subunit
MFGLPMRGWAAAERKQIALQALLPVRRAEAMETRPDELSGGRCPSGSGPGDSAQGVADG